MAARNGADAAIDRIETLENNRVRHEADIQGLLLKCEGKLHASNNAEARARTMLKHYETDDDASDTPSDQVEETVPPGYAPGSEVDGVPPVHMGLETNNKAHALRAKFS